jgi:DNA-binding CsgD family transcriptional regulator
MNLTDRERQILAEVASGTSNKLIARRAGISPCTVKTHVANIRRKVAIIGTNRVQLAKAHSMIKFEDVEKAVDWLRDSAATAAKARAERIYMEAYVKTVLAQQMNGGDGSIAAREAHARTTPTYLASLQALKEAVEADELNRFLRDAADAKVRAWQTQESTRRAEGKAYG